MIREDRNYLIVVALGAAWSLSGCSENDPGYTRWPDARTWQSRYFAYHARPEDSSVGAEVVDYLQANAETIARDYLNVDLDGREPIHYFKYASQDDFDSNAPCAENQLACTLSFLDGHTEVHSPLAVDSHELVHAYMAGVGSPPLFLVEGIAGAISCDPESAFLDSASPRFELEELGWREVFANGAVFGDVHYVLASLLTAWLVDQRGLPAFLDVYRALAAEADPESVDDAFEAVYGRSLETLWTAMVTAPTRRPCLSVTSCAVLDGDMPMGAAGHVVDALPPVGFLMGVADADQRDMPRGVHTCSRGIATSADVLWPAIGIGTYAQSAFFFANKTGHVVKPGRREDYFWDHGPVRAPSDVTEALSIDLAPTSCETASSIPIERSTALQLWPSSTPYLLQLRISEGRLPLVTAVVSGNAGPFEVKACAACESGVLEECESITESYFDAAPGVPDPWIQVDWHPLEANQILTVALLF